MYVQPNSTIKLLADVPLNPKQTDTLHFYNKSEQSDYFLGKATHTFLENTYQRVNRGTCRVNALADNIYNNNYMMFQNSNYSNKWFYAFINRIEYINDSTSEIEFTIDPMQTWYFDYTPSECFIERETTRSDNIGEHIEPENLGLGEYVINGNYEQLIDDVNMNDKAIVVCLIGDNEANVYDGVMTYGKLYGFNNDTTGISELEEFLEAQAQTPDNVINVYMCPKYLINNGNIPSDHVINSSRTGTGYFIIKDEIKTTDTLDGYLPKNNKMYTYPYSFYNVDTGDGQSLITRFEFFNDLKPRFSITGNITTPVEICCYPTGYKNTSSGGGLVSPTEFRPEKISIKGYPICNWSTDYYASWLAQNSVPMAISTASGLGIALGTGNPMVGAMAVSQASSILGEFYKASIHADISKGSFSTGSNNFANNRMNFKGSRMSVTSEFAKRIDDYFTMFGYNVGIIKRPERRLRTRFTYVKTIGCNIYGNLPSDDAQKIEEIYNNGIRFWADTENVGNYTSKNEPLD